MPDKAKEEAEKAEALKLKEAADKKALEEKELADAIAKEEAEKAEALKLKEAADKKAQSKFKKEYIVCVTGFYALGKMFRANAKISSKIYHDYIKIWLEKRYIK